MWDGLRFILRSRGIGFVLQRVCLGSAGGQAQRDDQKNERENSAATSVGLAFQIGSPTLLPPTDADLSVRRRDAFNLFAIGSCFEFRGPPTLKPRGYVKKHNKLPR